MNFISIDVELKDIWDKIDDRQLMEEVGTRACRDWDIFLNFFEEELGYRDLKVTSIEEADA